MFHVPLGNSAPALTKLVFTKSNYSLKKRHTRTVLTMGQIKPLVQIANGPIQVQNISHLIPWHGVAPHLNLLRLYRYVLCTYSVPYSRAYSSKIYKRNQIFTYFCTKQRIKKVLRNPEFMKFKYRFIIAFKRYFKVSSTIELPSLSLPN